jgi:hypothetical protein
MIPSFITLIIAIAATAIVVLLMFLPAIIELKKPKDAGPRLITDSFEQKRSHNIKKDLADAEDKLKIDC